MAFERRSVTVRNVNASLFELVVGPEAHTVEKARIRELLQGESVRGRARFLLAQIGDRLKGDGLTAQASLAQVRASIERSRSSS